MNAARLHAATFCLLLCACTATQDLGSTGGSNTGGNGSGGPMGTKVGPVLEVKQVRQLAQSGAGSTPLMVSLTLTAPSGSGPLAISPSYVSVQLASGRVLKAAPTLGESEMYWVDGRQASLAGEAVAAGASYGPWVVGFEADGYADPPIALAFDGPNGETSRTPLALEKGTLCKATATWTPTSCTGQGSYSVEVNTYPDRDKTFCGSCETVDMGLLMAIVMKDVGFPSGARVHPTQNYALGSYVYLPTNTCSKGVRRCNKPEEVVCPATVRVADTQCGGWRESYKATGVECSNLQTAPQHCGSCDVLCAAGQACVGGLCK